MLTIQTAYPGAPDADAIVRAYMLDVASRYHGRPATSAGVAQAMLDEPRRPARGICRERGARIVRLDTRADLTEACALHERLGFARVDAFNDERYSDRWYAQALS